jgi:hypothetical protein
VSLHASIHFDYSSVLDIGSYAAMGSGGCISSRWSAPPQYINVDNNARFRYLDDYWFFTLPPKYCKTALKPIFIEGKGMLNPDSPPRGARWHAE